MKPGPYLTASDPAYAPEGFTLLTVPSPHLNGRGDIVAYIPAAARGQRHVPCVMLLHGVCSSSWSWAFQAGAHVALETAIASGLPPMALVMPSDGLTFDGTAYLNSASGGYEHWITETVTSAMRNTDAVPEVTSRSPWFVAGLSMGGYGALSLSARHPDLFLAASAHSAVVDMADLATCTNTNIEAVVGDHDPAGLDLCSILTNSDSTVPTRIDCGLDDPFLASNRRLHTTLDLAGISHDYHEAPGGHEHAYWHRQLPESLRFFANVSAHQHGH